MKTFCFLFAIGAVVLIPEVSAQVFFDRDSLALVHGWVEGDLPREDPHGRTTYQSAGWRARMLEQFPQADADGDGNLSQLEALHYHMGRVRMFTPHGQEFDFMPAGTTHWTEQVPCRDGALLPTEIYLPPGQGPWPVVLARSNRGRFDSVLDYANEILRMGIAVVGQDTAPDGAFLNQDLLGQDVGEQELSREERAAIRDRQAARDPRQDGVDCIKWLRRQSWFDGNLAMTGYSEGSNKTKNALAGFPTGLEMINSGIGTITRAGPEILMTVRPGGPPEWEEREFPPLPESWTAPDGIGTRFSRWMTHRFLDNAARIETAYFDRTGWYDYFTRGAIVEWQALAKQGKPAVLVMGVGGHGSFFEMDRWFPSYGDADLMLPEISLYEYLRGGFSREQVPTRMYYFLMGDALDPSAFGNAWMVTPQWPPAHELVDYYLQGDGSLRKTPGRGDVTAVTFDYDPLNPVQTHGGNHSPSHLHGPVDQSHLRDRQDVLRFETPALEEALPIVGQVGCELYFQSDAPDTQLVAWLVDIYPDGYCWLIQEAALTLRFREGLDRPLKLHPDEVVRLEFSFTDTATALAPGHRLGVWISSSSYPTYEVHPNTWESIESYAREAKVARQQVHVGEPTSSRIRVPVPHHRALIKYVESEHDFRKQ